MTTAIVDRKELKKALEIVNRAVPKRTTHPVIQHIRLTAENGTLELVGTDLEKTVRLPIRRLSGSGKGSTLVPGARLVAHVKAGKGETVAFEWSGKDHITTVDAARFVGIAPDEYPEVPDFAGRKPVKIRGVDFAAAVAATKYAVSDEVVRYALMGIFFETKGKELFVVTSDGKRLARQIVPRSGTGDCKVILDCMTADLVARLAKRAPDAEVEMIVDAEAMRVCFRVDGARVVARFIDGHFPDWRGVMPKSNDVTHIVDRAELRAAVEQVALSTTDQTRAIRFTFQRDKVKLFTRAQDVGESTAEVATQSNRGEEIVTVLNPDYIVDYLKALPKDVETVTVHLKDRQTAVLFKTPSDKLHYVLMPLTITL